MSIYLAICFENPPKSYQYLQFQYNTMGFILVSFSFPTETPFSGSEKSKPISFAFLLIHSILLYLVPREAILT